MARYEDVKERSITGLSHAVEMKHKLVLDISIAPATIVVSEMGLFDEARTALIVDLGLLEIKTVEEEVYRPETIFEVCVSLFVYHFVLCFCTKRIFANRTLISTSEGKRCRRAARRTSKTCL